MSRLPFGLVATATAGLVLTACAGSDEAQPSSAATRGADLAGHERTVSGHGLSIELPPGWQGRVIRPAAEVAAQLIAGNFALPPHEDHLGPKTRQAMTPQSIYVWLAVDPVHEHLQPNRWVDASLPIHIAPSDFGAFEGVESPSEAVRWLIVDGEAVLVIVGFGVANPTGAMLAEANRVLASLTLTPPPASSLTACEAPGEWPHSRDAAWLQRAATVAGFSVTGCTGSAWIVQRRASFYLWTTTTAPSDRPVETEIAGATIYGDHVRLAWRAQGLTVWLEPGPKADELHPARRELAELVVATRRLPRRYGPIAMMPMPPGPLAKCRSSRLLRPACPRHIPRIPGWLTYPRYGNPVTTTFGIERGGEFPGKPELNRPPSMLHLEISANRLERNLVPFPWPKGKAQTPRDGLLHGERDEPIALGEVSWAHRKGTLLLAPPHPIGGSQGNHLIFRWREGDVTYIVGLHAWEPFTETVSILRRIVESASAS